VSDARVQRVVVTRALPRPALDLLASAAETWVSPHERALTADELRAVSAGAGAVLTMLYDRIDEAFFDAAGPQLCCVANVAAGYDNIDVGAAATRGVLVTNTPGVLSDATADFTIGLMLALTRRIAEGDRLLRAQTAWSWDMSFMLGTGLCGKTLGIVGLGEIGQAVARRATAFGMRIVYSARHRKDPGLEDALGGAAHRSLDQLLSESDVVSLHCPLSDATRGLVNADRLRLMRPGAFLINTSRGAVVDEGALVDALREGVIAGAALDVFEREPALHPGLLLLDNVVLTPHLGSATVETRTAMAVLAARNALAVLAREPALTPVSLPER
jgi:glyoxylate reductase